MSSDLFFEGKKYISSKRAAESRGYTQDYIGQLIRGKKIDARMIGRSWFVCEDSLASYQKNFDLFAKKNGVQSTISDTREDKTGLTKRAEIEQLKESPVRAIPQLTYITDDRALLPNLKKSDSVPHAVVEGIGTRVTSFVRKTAGTALVKGALSLPPGTAEISKKIIASMMSVALVFGGVWFSDMERARSSLAFLSATGGAMSSAIGGTFFSLAQNVRSVLDAYVATTEDSSERTVDAALAVGNVVSGISGAFTGESSSLAAVGTSGEGVFNSFSRGVLEVISSVSEKASSVWAGIFGEEAVSEPVADESAIEEAKAKFAELAEPLESGATLPVEFKDSETEAVSVFEEKDTTSATGTKDIEKDSVKAGTTYIQVAGIGAAEVDARIAQATAGLQSQIDRANAGINLGVSNTRSASTRDLTSMIYSSSITKSVISGSSAISDSTVDATHLSVTGGTVLGYASSTNLYASTLVADNMTLLTSVIGNSTTTYATSTYLSVFTAPIAPAYIATSSTATSTFAGGLVVGDTGFVFQQATKRIGIGTTTPNGTIEILQSANGTPMISAYRLTDAAPSGDFINYRSRAGTTLFRVDNSGNLLAGGIINTGSQTITSASGPQFRVQYDASNEITTTVSASGATTVGLAGATPSLAFTGQSNMVSAFNFTNASSASILSIDSLNRRVGIGTTTPSRALDVVGVAGFHDASGSGSHFRIGADATGAYFEGDPSGRPVSFWVGGAERVRFVSAGNVGVGTTTPWAQLSVNPNGVTGPSFAIGSSTRTDFIVTNGGNVGIGTASPDNKLTVAGEAKFSVNTADDSGPSIKVYDGNYGLSVGTNNALNLWSSGNFIFRNGSVGIGTTTPYAKLSVAGEVVGANFTATTTGFNSISSTTAYQINGATVIKNNGTSNFFAGVGAGSITTTGAGLNTGVGVNSLNALSTGSQNVSVGYNALTINAGGGANTAVGYLALRSNVSGNNNVGVGSNSLSLNTGDNNVAVGASSGALSNNTSGANNVGVGTNACITNGTGSNNTCLGGLADVSSAALSNATAIGANAIVAASNSLVLGGTGSNSVNVGIGTTTPWGIFSIASANSATSKPLFVIASSSAAVSTTTAFIVTNEGNVGVGTTTPNQKLTVSGTGIVKGRIESTSTAGSRDAQLELFINNNGASDPAGSILFNALNSSGVEQSAASIVSTYGSSATASALKFSTLASGVFAERMRINTDGNVGIGTTSPWGQLSASSTSAYPTFAVQQNSSGPAATFIGGNVGIGVTNPGYGLEVKDKIVRLTTAADSANYVELDTNSESPRIRFGSNNVGASGRSLTLSGATLVSEATFSSSGNVLATQAMVAGAVAAGTTGSLRLAASSDSPYIGFYDTAAGGRGSIGWTTGNYGTTDFVLKQNGTGIFDGTEVFRIKNNGNVGIGTTSPFAKLSIAGDAYIGGNFTATGTVALNTSTTITTVGVNVGTTGYFYGVNPGTATDTNNSYQPGAGQVNIYAGGLIVRDSDLGRRIRINSNAYKIEVFDAGATMTYTGWDGGAGTAGGDTIVRGGNSLTGGGGVAGNLYMRTGNHNGNSGTPADLIFQGYSVAATPLLQEIGRWKGTTGNLGIGSTTPWGQLSASTTSASPALAIQQNSSGAAAIFLGGNVGIGTTSPQRVLHVYRATDGAPVRFEDANGYCEIDPTSTTWTCTSDRSLKKDITNIASSTMLQRMGELQAVSFRWNKDDAIDPLRYGFIAQDVETVFPELVMTAANGLKSVAYGGFTPFIIEAIKELKISLDTLGARVDSIEDRLASLELFSETNGGFSSSTATTTASSTIDTVSGWFASLGVTIENTIARFASIVADSVTANFVVVNSISTQSVSAARISTDSLNVGTSTNPAAAGITIIDRVNGNPYCMYMANGTMQSQPGECAAAAITPAQNSSLESAPLLESVAEPAVTPAPESVSEQVPAVDPAPAESVSPPLEAAPLPSPESAPSESAPETP